MKINNTSAFLEWVQYKIQDLPSSFSTCIGIDHRKKKLFTSDIMICKKNLCVHYLR